MTIRLMNSAMMPCGGSYQCVATTGDLAKMFVQSQLQKGVAIVSYVGYPETAAHMSSVLGVPVEVSRAQTVLERGDVMVVCKLRYRVAPEGKKSHVPDAGDYEWFIVNYR